MRCEEFRALLERDGAAAAKAGTDHPLGCPACARELARWREVEAELAAMGEEPAPPFLHARIMAHVRSAGRPAQAPLGSLRPAWAGPLVVLVVLLGLGGVGLWHVLRPPLPALAPGEAVRAADAALEKSAPPAMVGRSAPVPVLEPAAPPVRQAARNAAGSKAEAKEEPRADAREREKEAGAAGAAEIGKPTAADREIALAAPAPEVPARSPEAFMETAAADEALPGEAPASRAVEPAAKGAAPARMAAAARPVEVRCQLLDDEGVPVATAAMPDDATPPVGTMWVTVVGAEGEVTVVDAEGAVLERVSHIAAKRFRPLPPPGRYRLVQAPLPDYR